MTSNSKPKKLRANQIQAIESVMKNKASLRDLDGQSLKYLNGLARRIGTNPESVVRYRNIYFDIVYMLYTLGAIREFIVKEDGTFHIGNPFSEELLECVENAIILSGMEQKLSLQESQQVVARVIELELKDSCVGFTMTRWPHLTEESKRRD